MKTTTKQVLQNRFISFHPTIEQVKSFFCERKVPAEEAELFFYYFESVGWRTDMGISIMDWKSFANQWIKNLGF